MSAIVNNFCTLGDPNGMQYKRLGTSLVTLSIKYSSIVVETMKSVSRHRCYYRLRISTNPRLSTGGALCLSWLMADTHD